MIYFEEVMSSLCSEAGRVYGGVTLVPTGRTTVDLDGLVSPWSRMCVWQLHPIYEYMYVMRCTRLELGAKNSHTGGRGLQNSNTSVAC